MSYLYSWEALVKCLPHEHAETNWQVVEHNSYPLRYQSFVETPVHHTGQICCQLKNKTFEWSRGGYPKHFWSDGLSL